ncbi:sodium:proton antiporter [Pseudomaricurvus alkylphenolicus]|uniref:Na+/H+ antiporter NhaC family protein n=1 Tax=Pseudomaricurvus alkylphenolicus TaxID=1306991 RepID=UPI00141DB7E9|nr:Na+/H+ antiporter NhaC family protein [Pseudomaricurvus alkylphenolicus]NIB40755.1 sodium:proton antiporter [Pseudomaricurvus alkylphenolicus]
MVDPGLLSILPTLIVVITAVLMKRALEALVLGAMVGFAMLSGQTFMSDFLDGVLKVMGDATVRWIVLTVALFGSIVALLVRSGGATAFAKALSNRIRSGPQALVVTWLMGLAIFIDDYLNALAVGNAMRRVTDKFKVSREMLAYVVDTTAAPVCILLPFSTWAIYVAGLLESNQIAETGQGLSAYLNVIPYMLYAWVAVIMPPLVATGVIPLLGSMRKAERLAQQSVDVSVDQVSTNKVEPDQQQKEALEQKGTFAHFLIPMVALVFFTWLFDVDILKGAFTTLLLTIVFYKAQGLMELSAIIETCLEGMKDMFEVIAILIMAFVLKDVNDQLQLTEYMIGIVGSLVNPALLPMLAFLVLSTIAFATGSFWGLYAIALPIVIPIAQATDINIYLMVGAVISAGAFGSHTCFYSDSTLLSAQGSGCTPMQHALTQLPYAVLAALVTAGGYLVLAVII